jgi:hypothetical protein
MWLLILSLFTAISISSVSAYFSILGLTAIFAAAKLPIIILGSTLEFGKVVSTLFVHRHWKDLSRSLKIYLVIAITILMMITSMGTFGFLSKAHLDQALPSDNNQIQLNIIDQKIQTDKDNITAAKQELTQLDTAVNQMMGRTTDATGAQRAVNIRKNQAKDRQRIADTIDSANKDLLTLQQQEAPLKAEQNKIAVEVGPIKYIADLIYGQSEDPNVLEKAVRIVILMLVSVFDPLAIVLLLATTSIMRILPKKKKEIPVEQPIIKDKIADNIIEEIVESHKEMDAFTKKYVEPEFKLGDAPSGVKEFGVIPLEEMTEEMKQEYEAEIATLKAALEVKASINDSLTQALRIKEEEISSLKAEKNAESERISQLLDGYQTRIDNYEQLQDDLKQVIDAERSASEELQKANNDLFDELESVNGKFLEYVKTTDEYIAELMDKLSLEHQNSSELVNNLQERDSKLAELSSKVNELTTPEAIADRMLTISPLKIEEYSTEEFGNEFPENPFNGQLFVLTNAKPHVVYKYIMDYGWVPVDKSTTDSYITDSYALFLVEAIASGEFDISELTEREQERITEVLTK